MNIVCTWDQNASWFKRKSITGEVSNAVNSVQIIKHIMVFHKATFCVKRGWSNTSGPPL